MYISIFQTELCALCGGTFIPARDAFGLCPRCREELAAAVKPISFPLEGEEAPCVCAGEYSGILVALIEAIKVHGRFRLLPYIAGEIVTPLLAHHFGDRPICPVPASRRGRRRRGFDQMQRLAHYLPQPVAPALRRRRGREQKHLSKGERLENARRSFALRNGRAVRGSILIDDVYTTGATVAHAARMLREVGTPIAGALVLATRR